MSPKIGVVRFLGTNCDFDIWNAVEEMGLQPEWLWFKDQFDIKNYSALIIPGGFSYGDYLRSGALAAKAPVMNSVREAANKGVPILGICNGFQILCESQLLPGALVKNNHLKFVDKWVDLQLVETNPYWGGDFAEPKCIPIAHGDGRYFCSEQTLKKLQDKGQVWLTYKNNPNGSVHSIAGVMGETKNVAGLMPHPERALFDWTGGSDGRVFFNTIMEAQL